MLSGTSVGAVIARGRTAEVYAWKEGHVLKLFFSGCSPDRIGDEARITRAVHASGLPVPAVREIVEARGRLGIAFERVDGPTMVQALQGEPGRLPEFARMLAELHADVNATKIVPGLPSQRRRLADKIRSAKQLSHSLREEALKALDALPDGDRLCHGDCHPGNVIMTTRGPVLIDWADATGGHPVADVARTSLLLTLAALPSDTAVSDRSAIEAARQEFHELYLDGYCERWPGTKEQLSAWSHLIAAARLSEGIAEENDRMLALVESGLSAQGRGPRRAVPGHPG